MGYDVTFPLLPNESLIGSGAVEFGRGAYVRVRGFRSFRDFQRRDISRTMPGWPPSEAPTEPPAPGSTKSNLRKTQTITEGILSFVLEAIFGGSTPPSDLDRADECDDFPVLWADPGTIAYGAPWQLDPSRNKKKPRAILHVTDQRLVFTDSAGKMIWELNRQQVKSTGKGKTTGYVPDVKITFVDGSWARIAVMNDKYLVFRGQLSSFMPQSSE